MSATAARGVGNPGTRALRVIVVEEEEHQAGQVAVLLELRELLQEDIRAIPVGHAGLGRRVVRMIDVAQADDHRLASMLTFVVPFCQSL